jgi:hypothetical protein
MQQQVACLVKNICLKYVVNSHKKHMKFLKFQNVAARVTEAR